MKNEKDGVIILTKEVLEASYAELKSLKAVARKFKIDPGTIKRYMIKYGLDFTAKIVYLCDEDFFSRDTEEALYWAGFIAADGCIRERKGIPVNLFIGLSSKDEEHLYKFKKHINAENPIKRYIVKNSKNNPKWNDTETVQFELTSRKIVSDLLRFGITCRKTKTYIIPDWVIVHPMRRHFIRGYFDGDGCISNAKHKDKPTPQFHLSFRGTDKALSTIRDIFYNDLKLPNANKQKKIRFNNGIGVLQFGGNGLIREFYGYFYNDATIYMQRKKDKFEQVFNYDEIKTYKDIITKDILEQKYNETNSLSSTAKYFNTYPSTILKYMKKYNLKITKNKNIIINEKMKQLVMEMNSKE